jgi:hypothetical protein
MRWTNWWDKVTPQTITMQLSWEINQKIGSGQNPQEKEDNTKRPW